MIKYKDYENMIKGPYFCHNLLNECNPFIFLNDLQISLFLTLGELMFKSTV